MRKSQLNVVWHCLNEEYADFQEEDLIANRSPNETIDLITINKGIIT